MASPAPPASAASRYLFVLIAGLLIGLVASVMTLRALQARQDPFPSSLMQVMGKQLALLERGRAQGRCGAADAQPRLQTLRLLGDQVDTAFPALADDARFREHLLALRSSLRSAPGAAPDNCAALDQWRQRIDEACDACHRDFR